MNWYLKVLKENYANFSGRARRAEYWMYTLINVIISTILYVLIISSTNIYTGEMGTIGLIASLILVIYALATFIPSIAVTMRRLHDTNKSGWLFLLGLIPLVGIVILVFLCTEGTKGDNKYGADPKAE